MEGDATTKRGGSLEPTHLQEKKAGGKKAGGIVPKKT